MQKQLPRCIIVEPNSEIKSVVAHPTGNINFEINYEFFNNHVISASLQDDYGEVRHWKEQKNYC